MTNDDGEKAERALLYAAYDFDASFIELYWNLFNGATLILAPEELRKDVSSLGDFLVEQKIDWAVLTPTLAGSVEPSKCARLKCLILGGEAPTLELLQNMRKYTNVFNGIGSTECSFCSAVNKFKPGDKANNVGRPLANSTTYVLNEAKLPVPLGAPGEMHVGGRGVGRGYWKRPDLNEERFIANAFGPGLLYKSGMAVRVLSTGDMQLLGRTDRQVKIRGLRIELREVGATVATEPKTPLEKQLCDIFAQVLNLGAVGTTDNFYDCGGNSMSALDLVFKLRSVGVGSFKAKDILDYPTVREILEHTGDDTAENQEEEQIELPPLPTNIGGARGSIMRRQSRSQRDLRAAAAAAASAAPVRGLIRQHSKQRSILKKYGSSRLLGQRDRNSAPRKVSLSPLIEVMLPMQEWVVNLCENKKTPAILACTLSLPEEQNIGVSDIEKALQKLALSHEVLRSSIKGKTVTIEENDSPVRIVDMGKSHANDSTLQGICASLNVEGGLLWRAALHSQNQLFLTFHPVIMDWHSLNVLVDEIILLLKKKSAFNRSSTYRKWITYVTDSAQFNGFIHAPFWDKMQSSSIQDFKMEMDFALRSQLELSEVTTSLLVADPKSHEKTAARTLVMASVARALSQVAGNVSNSIFTMSSGRTDQDVDVTRSIGLFQTMFPVLLDGSGNMSNVVNRASRTLGVIPEQGLTYMSLVKDGQVEKATPQVFVNYRDSITKINAEWPVAPFGDDTKQPLDAGIPLTIDAFIDPVRGVLVFNITSYLPLKKTQEVEHALQTAVDGVSEFIELKGGNANKKSTTPLSSESARGDGLAKRSSIRASRLIRTYHKSLAENTYIFLIHPDGSDSAVYKPLAFKLYESGFNPKGVDNNVIISTKKYEMARDLSKLGRHYRDTIMKNMMKAPEGAPIVILGWSLGGKIALEVAAQLEKDGYKNINLYLLDSFYKVTMLGADMESFVDYHMKLYYNERGGKVDKSMAEAHKHVVESEFALADADISGFLKHSRVTLFKAGKILDSFDDLQLSHVQLQSFDNGLNSCVTKLKVLLMEDHDHASLIEEEEEIVDTIVDDVSELYRKMSPFAI